MSQLIYKGKERDNYNATANAQIVFEHYYQLKQNLDTINSYDSSAKQIPIFFSMKKNVDIIIVFSVMSLESFFNNYIATCLNDDIFEQFFCQLGFIDKFELIVKIILKSEVEKDKAYYSLLKELYKNRNELVHSKSKIFDFDLFVEPLKNSKLSCPFFYGSQINKKEIKLVIKPAEDAIKAIRDVATFLDSKDSTCKAKELLFPDFFHFASIDKSSQEVMKEIKKEFKIKS